MSEALDRVVEALAGVSEDEVAAVLSELVVPRPRPSVRQAASWTPLPGPGNTPYVISEVEWV